MNDTLQTKKIIKSDVYKVLKKYNEDIIKHY